MIHDHEAILKRQAIDYWGLEPRNRPVKVTSIVRDPMLWTEGFVTCHKFIVGRTLPEVEKILGLPTGELLGGAYFYELLKTPTADQFELKGYSQCPDGKHWDPAGKYPVGLGAAQWRILPTAFIQSRLAAIIEPAGKVP